ncbi:MAG: transcription antitermination factor NusB [Deltaproteobacteria bacterium]|nr:transcription antitermination factor NusB [Deltaproteobacteria bacterium]MBW2071829.1 transcription antitermination factor NusB [Deltaproteobacteria bacterium]
MGRRHRSREMAVQVLYQADMTGSTMREAFQSFCEHFGPPEDLRVFARELVEGVQDHLEKIDALIEEGSEHWRLTRMSAVDRNVLRLAVFELLHRPDIPSKVTINEAVELGKKFGSEDSGGFINGILDRIRAQLETGGQSCEPVDWS